MAFPESLSPVVVQPGLAVAVCMEEAGIGQLWVARGEGAGHQGRDGLRSKALLGAEVVRDSGHHLSSPSSVFLWGQTCHPMFPSTTCLLPQLLSCPLAGVRTGPGLADSGSFGEVGFSSVLSRS